MTGIPGAGKSSWLENNFVEDRDYIISRDAIRFSMLKDSDEYFAKEDEVFKTFVKYIPNLSVIFNTPFLVMLKLPLVCQ